MTVELRHFRYFTAVAEELHFGRAAKRLHISQPSLSQAIRSLEAELGCTLLRRTSRRVELTTAGEVLLERARATVAMADAAVEAAREAGRGVAGVLRVGVTPLTRHGVAPAVLEAFRRRYPQVEIVKREQLSGPLVADLAAGELDAALVFAAEHVEGVAYEPVSEQSLMVIVPEGHPLAERRSVALAELEGERFLMPRASQSPGLHGALERLCLAAGFSPRVADETIEFDEDLLLLKAGRGIVVTTRDHLGPRVPGVRALALDPPEWLPVELAVHAHDRSPNVVRFADCVRELRAQHGWLESPRRAVA